MKILNLAISLLGLMPIAIHAAAQDPAVDADAVVKHYAVIVHAGYEDTLRGARELQKAVRAFTAQPSSPSLQVARRAWIAAREVYGQTEAFRFYGGPIDDERGPEGRMNSWPMDESFVDGVKGRPDSGLINDLTVPIDSGTLAAYNERGGEENISTGWHAIEFLLWGQDFEDSGPGNRSFRDFVDGAMPNADRRRKYLEVVTDLLVDDLIFLVAAWAPGTDNYRTAFENGGNESLRKIFVGMVSMSRIELAGERMEVALASQDREDEQSCFSDNTHRDQVNGALGIENVWLGRYRRADGSILTGPSPRDLVAARDAALSRRVTRQLAATLGAARAIQPPFDREILGADDVPGRRRVQRTVESLIRQSNGLVEAGAALDISRLNLTQTQ